MAQLDHRDRFIRSFDGTRIVYRVYGRGHRWLVIANGYGGTFGAWEDIIEHLQHDHRVLIWDYRGLHRSGTPEDRSRLNIGDHSRDLDALCEAEGVERMSLLAWSVGCQVALEHYRRHSETVDALALVNGAHGRVLERAMASSTARRLARPMLHALRVAAPVLHRSALPAAQRMAALPFTGALLHHARVFNGRSPRLTEAARDVLGLDYATYAHMILLANQHDADDVLSTIRVPTLVVGSDRDAITTAQLSRSIADCIPNAVYREVAGATHYGLMEFPDVYATHIRELLSASGTTMRVARL